MISAQYRYSAALLISVLVTWEISNFLPPAFVIYDSAVANLHNPGNGCWNGYVCLCVCVCVSASMEKDFSLDDFKRIFFWEYIHRMSGRGIAVLFGLPALYFLRKGWITKSMKPRLVVYGGLLAFQVTAVCLCCMLNVCCCSRYIRLIGLIAPCYGSLFVAICYSLFCYM